MSRLLTAGLLLATYLPAQTSSPEDLLRHAIELQQSGDTDGAVRGYREFLALRPNEVAAHSNLGVLLAHVGRYDEAIVEYRKAHALAPENAGIVLNLGLAYYKSGRIPEAARTFSDAREMAPDNLQTTLLLADCKLRMGDNRGVVTLLTPTEQQNEGDLAVAYMLGMALIRSGDVQEGQKRIDRILRNGDSAEARFLLGSQMLGSGDFPAAVKQFASAIELNPSLPDLQASYGKALLNTGDPDAAALAFRNELSTDPNHFDANLLLAQILTARQNWTEAEPLLRNALRVRPGSFEATLELTKLNIAQGKLKDARVQLEATEKTWPKSAAVHLQLAQVYQQLHLSSSAELEKKLAANLQPRQQLLTNGPLLGAVAPDSEVTPMGSMDEVTLTALRKGGPALFVFGSYTCPNFRSAADTLNRLYPEYKDKIPFYLIYIREAHSAVDWASTRNQREGISLQPATSMEDQRDHATMCVRKLHIAFPTLLDSMSGAAEKAYSAWPSKAFLLDDRGKVVFVSGLSEQDFKPQQLEGALRKLTTPQKKSDLRSRFQ